MFIDLHTYLPVNHTIAVPTASAWLLGRQTHIRAKFVQVLLCAIGGALLGDASGNHRSGMGHLMVLLSLGRSLPPSDPALPSSRAAPFIPPSGVSPQLSIISKPFPSAKSTAAFDALNRIANRENRASDDAFKDHRSPHHDSKVGPRRRARGTRTRRSRASRDPTAIAPG